MGGLACGFEPTAVALFGVLLSAASAQTQAVEARAAGTHEGPAAIGGAVGESHADRFAAKVAAGGRGADPVFGSGVLSFGFHRHYSVAMSAGQ